MISVHARTAAPVHALVLPLSVISQESDSLDESALRIMSEKDLCDDSRLLQLAAWNSGEPPVYLGVVEVDQS